MNILLTFKAGGKMLERKKRRVARVSSYSRLTVELPEELLIKARVYAARNKVTLKKICEKAIKQLLKEASIKNVIT